MTNYPGFEENLIKRILAVSEDKWSVIIQGWNYGFRVNDDLEVSTPCCRFNAGSVSVWYETRTGGGWDSPQDYSIVKISIDSKVIEIYETGFFNTLTNKLEKKIEEAITIENEKEAKVLENLRNDAESLLSHIPSDSYEFKPLPPPLIKTQPRWSSSRAIAYRQAWEREKCLANRHQNASITQAKWGCLGLIIFVILSALKQVIANNSTIKMG